MLPLAHAGASGVISILVWVYFKSAGYAAISFIAGVFIDLDHLIDYYLNHPFTARIKEIYATCAAMRLKKIYIVLHSYELIILLWISIFAFGLGNFWKAIAIGMTQHIIFDQITNPINTYGYFLAYRITKGFNTHLLIEEMKGRI